jgi:hypothetical protein
MEKIGWQSRFSEIESIDLRFLIGSFKYRFLNYNLNPKDIKIYKGYKDTQYIIMKSGVILHYIPHYNIVKEVHQWSCRGYKKTGMKTENGRYFQAFVHRIIATVFIPNPENKPEVNHKNRNKTDNRVENLEWVTRSENEKHKWRVGQKMNEETKNKIRDAQKGGKCWRAKKVKCIETGEVWDTAKEASYAIGGSRNIVSQACHTGGKAKGKHFIYI